jgi:hypothetical protein
MMRAGLAYLLTAAIFLHAALGCCWHGADNCVACDHTFGQLSHADAVATHHHHGQHHYGQHHDQKSQCPGPCKCRLECQGICNVVCPKKTELAKASWAAPFQMIAAFPDATPRLGLADRSAMSPGPAGFVRPLRAHLLLCVLLI